MAQSAKLERAGQVWIQIPRSRMIRTSFSLCLCDSVMNKEPARGAEVFGSRLAPGDLVRQPLTTLSNSKLPFV